jgi:hypothetical protein
VDSPYGRIRWVHFGLAVSARDNAKARRSYALWLNGINADGSAGGYADITQWFHIKDDTEGTVVAQELRV